MNSAVGLWPDKSYVFRAILGSLVAKMGVDGGPGGRKPLKHEIFTPQFTPKRPVLIELVLASFELFWSFFRLSGPARGIL